MIKKIIAFALVMLTVLSFATSAFAYEFDSNMYIEAYYSGQKKIPALMYHKVTNNPAEVTDWVITSDMLKADFEEIKKRGYSPITVSEYYELVSLYKDMNVGDNYKKIAEFFRANPKPIIITFDDGYKGIYTDVLPLMQQYGYKVNFYICGELIDSQHPEYCTWDEIKALQNSGLAEIGNHTYSLHSLNKDELYSTYQRNFEYALADVLKNNASIAAVTGTKPTTYSFPYGQYNLVILFNFKNAGFKHLVSTDYRTNQLADNQYALGRFNRSGLIPVAEYFDMVDSKCR